MARDAVLSDAEREEQIRELRAEARRATAQSEIEENARRWLETAGDDAAARASAFCGGRLPGPERLRGGGVVLGLRSAPAPRLTRTPATRAAPAALFLGRDGAARRSRRSQTLLRDDPRCHRRGSSMARRVSARRPRDFSVSAAAVSKASPCSERAVILASWALFRASAPP